MASKRSLRRDDSGSITVFVAFSSLLVVLLASSLARSGVALIRRAKADAAAEAAALGAVVGADPAAIAAANGAELVSAFRHVSGKWVVRVRVAETESIAAAIYAGVPKGAEWAGGPGSTTSGGTAAGSGGGKRRGLAPETLQALQRADALLAARGLPSPIPVVSGLRSRAEQQALWARRFVNPYPVAPPGTSAHERGLAIDIPKSWVGLVLSVAAEAGLCQPYPARDPIHFGPVSSPECGGSSKGLGVGKPVLVAVD